MLAFSIVSQQFAETPARRAAELVSAPVKAGRAAQPQECPSGVPGVPNCNPTVGSHSLCADTHPYSNDRSGQLAIPAPPVAAPPYPKADGLISCWRQGSCPSSSHEEEPHRPDFLLSRLVFFF